MQLNLVDVKPIRAAVATKDGLAINLHFGHAKTFLIYEFKNGCFNYLEKRDVDHYCHGQTGDASAMQKILKTLLDCHWAFVAKIGDGPTEKLKAIGVTAIDDFAYLGVNDALNSYAEKLAEAC